MAENITIEAAEKATNAAVLAALEGSHHIEDVHDDEIGMFSIVLYHDDEDDDQHEIFAQVIVELG